jgi:hypothetical protein
MRVGYDGPLLALYGTEPQNDLNLKEAKEDEMSGVQ